VDEDRKKMRSVQYEGIGLQKSLPRKHDNQLMILGSIPFIGTVAFYQRFLKKLSVSQEGLAYGQIFL
jgi:hypothetical protein